MILSCPSCGARFKIDAAKLGDAGRRVRCASCRHTWHALPTDDADAAPAEGARAATAEGAAAYASQQDAWDQAAAQADGPEAARSRVEQAGPEETGTAAATAAGSATGDVGSFERTLRAPRDGSAESRAAAADRRPAGGAVFGWVLLVLVVAGLAAGLWQFRTEVVARVPEAAQLYRMAGIEVGGAAAGLELRDVTRSRRLVDGSSRLVIEGTVANVGARPRDLPMLEITLYDAAGDALTSWRFAADAARLAPGDTARFTTSRDDPPDTAREFALTFAADAAAKADADAE
jgi:predicted Zn finger-like uncharacterized protein